MFVSLSQADATKDTRLMSELQSINAQDIYHTRQPQPSQECTVSSFTNKYN
jgi:hypothetical protein